MSDLVCANPECEQPIEEDEVVVYWDTGAYHMGCEFEEVYQEAGSGGFERD